MTTVAIANPVQLWEKALDELQGQMTRAMFDTWLAGTRASDDRTNGRLVVECHNRYAVEWCDARLRPTIERTLRYIHGAPVDVAFIVHQAPASTDAPEPPAASAASAIPAAPVPDPHAPHPAPEFDPFGAGHTPIANYALLFWAAFLAGQNRHAFRVWEIVRESDKRRTKDLWTPARRYTVPQLAALVPCSRQALVGVNRRAEADHPNAEFTNLQTVDPDTGEIIEVQDWFIHQDGAFDVLQREGIARIERRGERTRAVYRISVLVRLPLLHPSQAALLPPALQIEHDRWLSSQGLDEDLWN